MGEGPCGLQSSGGARAGHGISGPPPPLDAAQPHPDYFQRPPGLIALDIYGNITVGVSTSGAPFKYPGRVGDSPLPGCGLYADKQVGAAAATGDGDMIMCFCPCFHVILLMKEGMSPMDACQTVVQDILQRTGKENMFELGIIAMNMKGEVGAASSMSFPYCIWSQGKDVVEQLVHEA
ncbi:N(4)-(Beta-N-acetylglucosaminyl)-L-asparaginase [Varanus komodoensis]|nr:N(4)-(Beta-N-acetylglucosaminyl)-L-asparaginase [Varanus komodoensis]